MKRSNLYEKTIWQCQVPSPLYVTCKVMLNTDGTFYWENGEVESNLKGQSELISLNPSDYTTPEMRAQAYLCNFSSGTQSRFIRDNLQLLGIADVLANPFNQEYGYKDLISQFPTGALCFKYPPDITDEWLEVTLTFLKFWRKKFTSFWMPVGVPEVGQKKQVHDKMTTHIKELEEMLYAR